MGIRHLQTYMLNKVPNGCVEIDIAQEVQEYIKKYRRNPTLLVDSMTLAQCVCGNNHEILLSGRYNIFNERAHNLFKSLKSLGVTLVFFIDGPAQEDKIVTCLERRHNNYINGVKVLDYIGSGGDLSAEPAELKGIQIPNLVPFFANFIKIAAEYGEVHISTLNECDLEIANFANNVGALAIISNDTDFLIYEGDWRYWSSSHMSYDHLRTLEFNRVALRTHLKLRSHEMCLFATLGGNDILKYQHVQNFHRRIASNADKFFRIAQTIKSLSSYPPRLKMRDLTHLSRMIFGAYDREYGVHLIQQSLKSYSYTDMRRSFEDPVLESASQDTHQFNFVILGDRPYIITLFYVDLRDKQFAPFMDMILPIVRRQMGILLYRMSGNRTRTFYCKFTHDGPYIPQKLTPILPQYDVPPVEELLYTPYGTNPTLDELRWKLLFWEISEKMTSNEVVTQSKDMAYSLLCLVFLVEKKQITIDEADCLLLALNCPPDIQNTLKMEDMKVINCRDAVVAYLFTRMHFFVMNCFWAVGLRDFDSLITFDGLYFHNLRREYRLNAESLKERIAAVENLRIYVSVLN